MATNNNSDNNRGFAGMDEDKQREIASKGGKASGGNFRNDPERAAEAGRKGGESSHGGQQSQSGGSQRQQGSDTDKR